MSSMGHGSLNLAIHSEGILALALSTSEFWPFQPGSFPRSDLAPVFRHVSSKQKEIVSVDSCPQWGQICAYLFMVSSSENLQARRYGGGQTSLPSWIMQNDI